MAGTNEEVFLMGEGPPIGILKADGVNCEVETAKAFAQAGGDARIVHINELREREVSLQDFRAIALPGGFSYGDDVASGKMLALELTSYLGDQINDFVQRKKGLVLGICNGFQVLVRSGLLPFGTTNKMQATLVNNESGHFECRWINLKVNESACAFVRGMPNVVNYQVAHGEGRFFTNAEKLQKIEQENLVVFKYCDTLGEPTQQYPQNPNGSLNAIAGICDPSGRILGLMPHPERFVSKNQHPNWRRMTGIEPHGLPLFKKMVEYASQM